MSASKKSVAVIAISLPDFLVYRTRHGLTGIDDSCFVILLYNAARTGSERRIKAECVVSG